MRAEVGDMRIVRQLKQWIVGLVLALLYVLMTDGDEPPEEGSDPWS